MEGFRRRRDEMILGGVQHVAWPTTVAGKGSPSGLALRAGKLAWERAISSRGLPALSSAPLSLRLIPGVGERQSFVPLFTLSSPSHQHPSCWALCGSWEQGTKGPPNPVETHRLVGWEAGVWPQLWGRASLEPQPGPRGRPVPEPGRLSGSLSGREGSGGLPDRTLVWLECGERREGSEAPFW